MAKSDGHEQYIREQVARILGASVTEHDDGSQPGMYDATLTHPDGHTGALEVTRVVASAQFQLAAYAQNALDVPDSPHDWLLSYANTITIPEIRQNVPELVKLCDADDLERPTGLDRLTTWPPPPLLAWYHGHQLWLARVGPKRDTVAKVYLTPHGFGGVVNPDLAILGDWLSTQTGEDWFTSNTTKLVRSGLPELHLAVSLHESAVPGDVLYSFMKADPAQLAIDANMPFAPLTDLWVFVPFAPWIAHWSATGGWSLHNRNETSPHA